MNLQPTLVSLFTLIDLRMPCENSQNQVRADPNTPQRATGECERNEE